MSLHHPRSRVATGRWFHPLCPLTGHSASLSLCVTAAGRQYYQAGTSLQSDVMIHIQMDHQEAMTCAAGHGRWLLLGLSPKLPRSGSVQALH
jgi:hypothetical protein